MTYVICESKKNIQSWKAHLIRAINQDEARLSLLQGLDPASVPVVLDWAIKFWPWKYCESQSDWFGKRDISWHIAVAMTRREDLLEMMIFPCLPKLFSGYPYSAGYNRRCCRTT